MVEALEWMLLEAASSEESMIVLLDWYSGHRTKEVMDVVARKGHVLLFHGGGTTLSTQANDTHLHALLQNLLVKVGEYLGLLGAERGSQPRTEYHAEDNAGKYFACCADCLEDDQS